MLRSRFLLLTATAAVALSACATAGTAPAATSPSSATSVAELEAARSLVGPAAVAVGRSARRVSLAASSLEDVAGVGVLDEERSGLADAVDEARAVRGSDGLPAEVGEAVDAVVEAGDDLVELAGDVVDGVGLQLDLGSRVRELVDRWDDDASRSQQIERLGAVEDELRAVADADLAAPSGCAGGERAWRRVAARAADLTAALVVHVRGYDGTSFDATRRTGREELDGMAPDGPGPGRCDALAQLDDAAASLESALGSVETALNPAELVTDG